MQIHRNLQQLPVFEKSVITIGSFDGVHIGHQKIISRINQLAKEIKGESVVITFYPHPRQVIYPLDNSLQLLTSLEEKLSLLKRFGVDHVVVVPFSVEFSQQNPREYIEKFLCGKFNPAYIVVGYDHKFGLNRQGDMGMLQSYEEQFNFKTIKIEEQELEDIIISSTKIRNALLNNDLQLARKYLNYNYMISGKVVYGEQIGQKIGFKTANIQKDDRNKLVPIAGIYSARVFHGTEQYGGMLYVGNKPTIHENGAKSIEVNIFDFDENIYGENLRLEIVDFIRPDEKFDSLFELKEQLKRDEISARGMLAEDEANTNTKNDSAIVILNYNGEEILESYLPSTLHSTDRDIDYVIIDNASQDDSVEFIREWHPEYTLLEFVKNYGYAGGYNKGLQQMDYKYVVLINSDIQCTQSWLDPILDQMDADPTIAAISPKIRSIEEPNKFEYAGASGGFIDYLGYPFCRGRLFQNVEKDEGQYDEPREIFWASGAAMIVRKEVFDKLGGFDESYFAHQEEIDLCWRMKRAGYKVMVNPSTHVYHLGGGTLAYESPNKTYLNFRNSIINLIKNDESGFWFLKFLARLLLDGLAAIQILFKGQTKNMWAIVRAHWYIYPRFFEYVRQRKALKKLIDEVRIGPSNKTGIMRSSVVWQHFGLGKKTFSKLNIHE